jgi:2-oxoglutarate dehydrogenase E2 component (dihydrolipoamide succinyltransferase)
MGLSEGTIVQWLKEVGDPVVEDEPIVEVETAKATDVVGATVTGTLAEIVVEAGAVVPVSDLIAVIETNDD